MSATLFTPSYRNDLDRAVWMRRSVRRFLQERCRHLIAVPKSDIHLFAEAFADDHGVELVCQEDAVDRVFYPDRLYRLVTLVANSQSWRFERHAGRPGWIIQQVVKLNCTRWVDAGAVLFIDSDLVFVRPFSLTELGITAGQRVLVRITPELEASRHRDHVNRSREILGLPAGASEHHYMACPAIWYADWLKQLHEHIEALSKMSWQSAIRSANHISEYTLYGLFVEEILKPEHLVIRSTPFHHIAFDSQSFRDIKNDPNKLKWVCDNRFALVVQSNLDIPVREYEYILDTLLK